MGNKKGKDENNMKIIKRNQLVILVIALMLVTAGYLNYTSNLKNQNSIQTSSNLQMAGIGDATLVSSQAIEENISVESSVSTEDKNTVETNQQEGTKQEQIQQDDYFADSKLQRESMYSGMLESYQKMLDSTTIGTEQKAIAQKEITKINNTKNAIMIAENLIKTKGFQDVLILVNDANINVVIKAEKLETNEIAQIQNIIAREMNANIENIHISNKLFIE